MAITAHPEPTAAASTRIPACLADAELVAEVRRGDDRAFEELYDRYHRRIAAYVLGMVGDHGRTEDVAQEVFMSALRRMRETERPIAFKPWIYEIARNACIDQFRRARRTDEVSFDAEQGLAPADHVRLVDAAPAPDVAVDQKLAIDHLRGAFGGLSRTHHQILVMREFEGLSYRAIGERLDMSRSAVESTLFRARRRLGEEYEELVSGERCQRVQAIIDAAVPGARDQRRLAVHLSHCQACRRHASVAERRTTSQAAPRGLRSRIASLLPLPAFLRHGRGSGGDARDHHVASLAQFSARAGVCADPAVTSWAKAAAAAVGVAIAGVAGGAVVTSDPRPVPAPAAISRDAGPPRAATSPAPATAPGGSTGRRPAPSTAMPRDPARRGPGGAPAVGATAPGAAALPAPGPADPSGAAAGPDRARAGTPRPAPAEARRPAGTGAAVPSVVRPASTAAAGAVATTAGTLARTDPIAASPAAVAGSAPVPPAAGAAATEATTAASSVVTAAGATAASAETKVAAAAGAAVEAVQDAAAALGPVPGG